MMGLFERLVKAFESIAQSMLKVQLPPAEVERSTTRHNTTERLLDESLNAVGQELKKEPILDNGARPDYEAMTTPALKKLCVERGLPFTGQARKNTVIGLLRTHDAKKPIVIHGQEEFNNWVPESKSQPGAFDLVADPLAEEDPLGMATDEVVTNEVLRDVLTAVMQHKDGGKEVVFKLLETGAGVRGIGDLKSDPAKLKAVHTLAIDFLR